ncbi:MAG TPA: hypothetical protein VG944_13100 [Fimbriimonas sp.]|nr:hypothetical protein [Fimbriimonas sp.]
MSATALREKLEPHDGFADLRNGLRRMAEERGDYSGCPIPIDTLSLVIEPTYKYKGLEEIGRKEEPKVSEDLPKIRNIFWSNRKGCRVAICEQPEGEFWAAPLIGSSHGLVSILHTLDASDVWGIEQEHAALQLLGTMLRHRQFKQYLLTGTFMESSPRSGVAYVFRKLRPTVAIRPYATGSKVLCTMCMHPIGYYEESWAGCMCPTDDVIAHLALMRGDEHMFWRRCNQHAAHDPSGGL